MTTWKLGIVGLSIAAILVAGSAGRADARITIRPRLQQDDLFFHAQYSKEPFDPADDFTLEIWNCASGVTPTFLSGADPLVVCLDSSGKAFAPADLAYAVRVPGGTCEDHGRSCYYRDPALGARDVGIRYFRVQYATRDRGNKVWLETTGDLSAATQANMLLLIAINGRPRAILQDTFDPLPNGGWFSDF